MLKEISRREFLRMAGLTAAGVALTACAPKKDEPVPTPKDESIPTPKPWGVELTTVPPLGKEIMPTPTWEPQKTEVSFLPEAGGQSITGELVRANDIQPAEAERLTDNQKRQLGDALAMGGEWVRYLVAKGYGDEGGLRLCVAIGKTSAFAARVEKAGGYAKGTLFVEGKNGDVLTISPFSEGDKIKALGDKEGRFQGWALFDNREQLIARVDTLTNRWLVGSGESEEYWLPKLNEFGMDLSPVTDPRVRAAIAETAFYSLQADYGANFDWNNVGKSGWSALFIPEKESAKVLLFNGKKVFERKYESEWGREFVIKDKDGNWVGAWLTRPLERVPSGEIVFNEGKLQVLDKVQGTHTFNWDKHEWESTPKSVAKATSQPTAQPTPTPIKEKPTATPTKEGPKEYVTWVKIDIYSSQNGEKIGYVFLGKHFTILKEQGDWIFIHLEAGGEGWIRKSETAYGLVGTEPKVTPEPSRRFPKEIVLGNGQLVIHNMGIRHGVIISDGGFRDKYGNYCFGGGSPCEEKKGFDTGMRPDNTAFLNEVIRKYGGDKGKLEIFFYDDPQKNPYFDKSQKYEIWYRYCLQEGNVFKLYMGVDDKSFDPTFGGYHWSVICMAITAGAVIRFLRGDNNSLIYNTSPQPGPLPNDLVAIAMYTKLEVK